MKRHERTAPITIALGLLAVAIAALAAVLTVAILAYAWDHGLAATIGFGGVSVADIMAGARTFDPGSLIVLPVPLSLAVLVGAACLAAARAIDRRWSGPVPIRPITPAEAGWGG